MRKFIKFILLVLWMMLIFYLSAQSGSESSGLSNAIVIRLIDIFSIDLISFDTLSLIIRKAAHFSEYAILGILISINLEYDNKINIIYAISFCFIYALTDEIHQYFVSNRYCSFIDILIDTSGSVFAIILYRWIKRLF